MTLLPHELEFVLDVPESGIASQQPEYDVYRPAAVAPQPDGAGSLPAVVLVPGPMPAEYPVRPRRWPVYQGYGHLLAGRGVVAVVVDLPYHGLSQWRAMADELSRVVDEVRRLDGVDPARVAVWAFSGGAMLVGRWLADTPAWLRCLALTYPVLEANGEGPGDLVRPGRPVVLTRVGREHPDRQATVDRFLATADATGTAVRVIDVPDGQHGFDALDHTDQSREAVSQAVDLVVEKLS